MVTAVETLHDLPILWDGHAVLWTPWRAHLPTSMQWHAPKDACGSCGSVADQSSARGYRALTTESTWEQLSNYENAGRLGVVARMRFTAFRCPDCGHDVVLDHDTDEWWDLDADDYTPAGSVERPRTPAVRVTSSPATTYGSLRWENGTWIIDATPHVSMRIKRLFPRIWAAPTPDMWLRDTPEVARDLEWLLQRHPLDVDNDTLARLTERSQQHRDLEQTRAKILAGQHRLSLKDPARPPREYQVQAADLCLSTGRLLLADDVGLGKTFSSLLLLRDPEALPAVVVTLTHLPRQWLRELEASLPWLTGHVATKGTAYDVEADVLILNYAKLAGWGAHLAGQAKTVIFDEIQELRRGESMKYQAARQIASEASFRMGLSATPVYNYGGEVHTIMQVLAPDELGSRQEFIREWGGAELSGGRVRVKDPNALGTHLRDEGLMLRRTRKDVHRELPDPIRIVHEVDSNPAALAAVQGDIRALAELVRNSTGKSKFTASGELDWKMRQATGIAKAPFVAEFVRLLLESEDQVVLFGWHRAVYDIWMEALAEFDPVLYTGSESPNQKQASTDAFMSGNARVLIMSLRSGAGLDGLQERASALVFGELDWSPAMHDQCIGRLARDGQESTVAAYFLVTEDGSDPVIAQVLELKRQQAEPIRDPDQPLLAPTTDTSDRIGLLVDSILTPKDQA